MYIYIFFYMYIHIKCHCKETFPVLHSLSNYKWCPDDTVRISEGQYITTAWMTLPAKTIIFVIFTRRILQALGLCGIFNEYVKLNDVQLYLIFNSENKLQTYFSSFSVSFFPYLKLINGFAPVNRSCKFIWQLNGNFAPTNKSAYLRKYKKYVRKVCIVLKCLLPFQKTVKIYIC